MAKAVTLVHNPQRTSGFICDWGSSTVASATLFNRYRALCGLAQWVHIADHHSGCCFPPSGLPAELTQWREALMYSDRGAELPKSLQVCGRMLKSRVAKRGHARGFPTTRYQADDGQSRQMWDIWIENERWALDILTKRLACLLPDARSHPLHHSSCDYQWSHGGSKVWSAMSLCQVTAWIYDSFNLKTPKRKDKIMYVCMSWNSEFQDYC